MQGISDQLCRHYLSQAYRIAWISSDDPHTQTGAVLVVNGSEVRAANHVPYPGPYDPSIFERPQKYKHIEHAERHVIYKAAKLGVQTIGGALYAPWACCCECARAIIASGIKCVIVHSECMALTPERWQEDIKLAKEMLYKSGIVYHLWSGKLGNLRIVFNEQDFEP